MKLGPLTLLLSSLLPFASTKPCTTDDDCSLNGLCTSQTCICDPGWTGTDCGRLDLAPATRGTGYNHTTYTSPTHYKEFGNSSWGGQIEQDRTNPRLFHLLVDQFAYGCGLNGWRPTSFVARAESTSGPQGPYHWVQNLTSSFRHNTYVHWNPSSSSYLLWTIGVDAPSPIQSCKSIPKSAWPNNISVSSAPSLPGPWSPFHLTVNGTNPAPLPLHTPANHSSAIALATEDFHFFTAPAWNASYTRIPNAAPIPWNTSDKSPTWSEDPFLWRDRRGNHHMLAHWMIDLVPPNGTKYPRVGAHMFSRALQGPWTFVPQEAYSSIVDFGAGDVETFKRRERPKLVFSSDGEVTPLYLVTGVQALGEGVGGRSYTLVQPVGNKWRDFERELGF